MPALFAGSRLKALRSVSASAMETRDLLNVGAFRGWLEEDHPELLHSLYKTWVRCLCAGMRPGSAARGQPSVGAPPTPPTPANCHLQETHLDTMEMRRLLAEVTALPEAVTPATASPALPAGQLRQAAAASPAVEEEAAPAVASPAAAGAAPAQQPHASPDVIDLLSDAEEDEAVIVPAGTLPAGEAAAAAATADQAAPAPSEHNAGQVSAQRLADTMRCDPLLFRRPMDPGCF